MADQAYDRDGMRRTLRAKFIVKKRMKTRDQVTAALNGMIDVTQLQAIYKCGEGPDWHIVPEV